MNLTEQEKYHLKYALYEAINNRVKTDKFVCGQATAWFDILKRIDTEASIEIKEKVNNFLKDCPNAIVKL